MWEKGDSSKTSNKEDYWVEEDNESSKKYCNFSLLKESENQSNHKSSRKGNDFINKSEDPKESITLYGESTELIAIKRRSINLINNLSLKDIDNNHKEATKEWKPP